MMNFTQLQNIIGTTGLAAIPEDVVPTNTQEVNGFKELEGTYIDFRSFELIHERLRNCKDLDFKVRMEDIDPVDAPVDTARPLHRHRFFKIHHSPHKANDP